MWTYFLLVSIPDVRVLDRLPKSGNAQDSPKFVSVINTSTGPFDLAKQMGVVRGGDEHEAAIQRILRAAKAANKRSAIFCRFLLTHIASHILFPSPSLKFILKTQTNLLTMNIQALADLRRDCARSRALIWSLS